MARKKHPFQNQSLPSRLEQTAVSFPVPGPCLPRLEGWAAAPATPVGRDSLKYNCIFPELVQVIYRFCNTKQKIILLVIKHIPLS